MSKRGRPAMKAPNGFMTIKNVADAIGVHYVTAHDMIQRGTIGSSRVKLRTYVSNEDFDAFVSRECERLTREVKQREILLAEKQQELHRFIGIRLSRRA